MARQLVRRASWRPSGTVPVRKYTSNATSSFRASTTIPIRRRREPPLQTGAGTAGSAHSAADTTATPTRLRCHRPHLAIPSLVHPEFPVPRGPAAIRGRRQANAVRRERVVHRKAIAAGFITTHHGVSAARWNRVFPRASSLNVRSSARAGTVRNRGAWPGPVVAASFQLLPPSSRQRRAWARSRRSATLGGTGRIGMHSSSSLGMPKELYRCGPFFFSAPT